MGRFVAESTKFEAQQPTTATDAVVLPEPWKYIFRLTLTRCGPSYFFQFLQMQRTDHLPIERVRHTREPPDMVNVVGLPFMLNSKLNTGAGVQRIKVPY